MGWGAGSARAAQRTAAGPKVRALAVACVVIVVGAAIPGASAAATTFTVNTTDDVDTGSCSAIHCSLRSAINAANAAAGADSILFAIPGPGPYTIQPLTPLPSSTGPVTIDGTTQPGYAGSPIIELNGSTAGGSGLVLRGGASTVRGLVINRFAGGAGIFIRDLGGDVIEGNFIGTDVAGTLALPNDRGVLIFGFAGPGNRIGGLTAAARNLISGNAEGVLVSSGTPGGNVVEGNFIGTDVTGTQALGNVVNGVDIADSGNTLGGTAAGAGNVISANGRGVLVGGLATTATVIQGNFIGTDVTGTQGLGNVSRGVEIQGPSNVLGGTVPGAGNVISANGENGVVLAFVSTTGNVVQGNLIGTDAGGSAPLGNGASGVALRGNDNAIGGTAAGAGNVIAYNGAPSGSSGVFVIDGTGNAILGNSIFSNGALGIDLFPFGVTPNDPGDADTGANELQNFPQLTSAGTGGGSTTVTGTLNSRPSTTYRFEFFANTACDPSGFGEGETFLSAVDVTTDASGNATFSFTLGAVPAGQAITATATDPSGNTSEFSNCAPVAQIVVAAAVTLSPAFAVNDVGTSHTVTATVSSVSTPPQPQAGVTVRFAVQGSVTTTGTCTTAANGQCSFTYSGPALPGADLITAYPDLDSDGVQDPTEISGTATKAWALPASTPGQVTGGGQAPGFAGGSIAFGFNAKSTAGGLQGNCTVVDGDSGTKIKCLGVTSLVVAGTHATFFGDATINGVATTYRIDVDDLGEAGAGHDTFTIETASGYLAGGVLTAGNIQIHH